MSYTSFASVKNKKSRSKLPPCLPWSCVPASPHISSPRVCSPHICSHSAMGVTGWMDRVGSELLGQDCFWHNISHIYLSSFCLNLRWGGVLLSESGLLRGEQPPPPIISGPKGSLEETGPWYTCLRGVLWHTWCVCGGPPACHCIGPTDQLLLIPFRAHSLPQTIPFHPQLHVHSAACSWWQSLCCILLPLGVFPVPSFRSLPSFLSLLDSLLGIQLLLSMY